MRYYVVINGETSLNIQGLAIQSLPNISKPLMRSRREEIDGRDGDIITKLGYSAYDKTLKIGLWGNYDINQVIAFFNQEGVITFSNEPDKYYNFTILNREDYINQLEAFREASITIHCQPYKYELNEQPVEIENEYVEETGTSLTFENSIVAPMNIDLKGNTLQNGTPTPSIPIPVNNVSGDNDIVVCGKNLLDISENNDYITTNASQSYFEQTSITFNNGSCVVDGTPLPSGNGRGDWFYAPLVVGETYTLDFKTDGNFGNVRLIKLDKSTTLYNATTITGDTYTFTATENGVYFRLWTQNKVATLNYAQLEKGNQASTYKAYNGTTYNIDLPVENLFDKDNANIVHFYATSTGFAQNNNANSIYIPIQEGKTYTISSTNRSLVDATPGVAYTNKIIESTSDTYLQRTIWGTNDNSITTTAPNGATYMYIYVKWSTNQTDINNCLATIQIEESSKPNSFTPYGTTPIELNKIGTYQDYIYKENDKWYLHKEIGKIVLNGSESWAYLDNTYFGLAMSASSLNGVPNTSNTYCDLFKYDENRSNLSYKTGNNAFIQITIQDIGTTSSSIKTWLSSHNTTIYYALATPTNTEITYTPLIEQLESIKNAMSKEGTTNVNQVNNDAPFIITASVLSGSNSVIVNNKGNIYSKPVMTIYGSGNIGVYLSDTQIFSINLGSEEYITLDTANMEAYKVGVLKNRLVSGDYNSFKLETGNNTLTFTGIVEKVVIENYSRWI